MAFKAIDDFSIQFLFLHAIWKLAAPDLIQLLAAAEYMRSVAICPNANIFSNELLANS